MKNITVVNKTNQTHSMFLNKVFEKIEREIHNDPNCKNKSLVFSRESESYWVVKGLDIVVEFEDYSRNDIQHVTIREVG